MADDTKNTILKKLENASGSTESYAFLNQDISDLKLSKLQIKDATFQKCNFYVTAFYRMCL